MTAHLNGVPRLYRLDMFVEHPERGICLATLVARAIEAQKQKGPRKRAAFFRFQGATGTSGGPKARQTLNKKFITSPSLTTYSLPSARILPASLAPCSPL